MNLARPLAIIGLAIGATLPALGIGRSGDGVPLASPAVGAEAVDDWQSSPQPLARDSMRLPDSTYRDSAFRDTSWRDTVGDTLRKPPPRHHPPRRGPRRPR